MALKKLTIESFVGLDQSVDENLISPSYSPDAANVSTDGGQLSVAKGYIKYAAAAVPETGRLRYMTCFRTTASSYPVVVSDSKIYAFKGNAWTLIHTIAGSLINIKFSSIMARINTTDYLIIADGKNQLIKYDGTSVTQFGSEAGCSNASVSFLTMYRGRLFASGDPDNPDRLYYSVLPGSGRTIEDWGSVEASPNVEGGYVEIGQGGGDPIVGIYALSNQLLIFKKYSLYRLIGDRPSNYTVEHIDTSYLCPVNNAIAAYGDVLFFLTKRGLYYYNGVTARPSPDIFKIKKLMNNAITISSQLVIIEDKLYFNIKIGLEDKLIEYDLLERKYMLREGFSLSCMTGYSGVLMFTNSNRYVYIFNRGTSYDGEPINARWRIPTSDLGDKTAIKNLNGLYLRGSGGYINITTRAGQHTDHYRRKLPQNTADVLEVPLINEGRCIGLTLENDEGGAFSITGGLELMLSVRYRTI